jgi:hypothetical protein
MIDSDDPSLATVVPVVRRMFDVASRLDWKSYDPFDLLLSPHLRSVPRLSPFAARVLVQTGRRTGVRVRRLLRVPQHEEPKTLAEFLRAAVLLAAARQEFAREFVPELSRRLRSLAAVTPDGLGWGITFPYVSRFGYIDAATPTIYDTTVASQALLDEHDWSGDASALDAAAEGCRFLLEGLSPFEHAGRQWLPYVPGSRARVVNVQASSASLLARVGVTTGRPQLPDAADRAAATVLACQRPDGSWPYSDDGRGEFVDGFHTGFTLEGLREYSSFRGGDATPGVDEAIDRGFAFFRRQLVTDDGVPRGFAGGGVSLDGQNVGQCVDTLLACGDAADRRTALRLWTYVFAADSGTKAPKTRFPALRWTLGPAVLAGARLVASLRT